MQIQLEGKMRQSVNDLLFHPYITIDVKKMHNEIALIPNQAGNQQGEEFMPLFARDATYWYPYEEWCTEHHPDIDPVRCLIVFLHHKK